MKRSRFFRGSRAVVAVVAISAVGCAVLTVGVGVAGAEGGHAPIVIASDGDFASCQCVVSGSGTSADPFVIGPWPINNVNGVAVSVDGTNLTKSFVLSNLTIAGNATASDTGIVLNHICAQVGAQVRGLQTSIQTNNVGILVENSANVVLDGGGANPNGPGISERGAGTINKNASGAIDVENSSNITIRGWQLSANGGDHEPDWLRLDPGVQEWGVGGVRFFGVSNSLIDHNAANNDTDVSYSLFASDHNTLTGNTGDYPFTMNYLLTDGSSYNTLRGNESSTGDFIGLMIADPLAGSPAAHDNLVTGNTIHTDGPTGTELSPIDITPAFLGVIVLLNGTYNNTISNNQTWASFGSDLAWAQAVPDASSAIGVETYKPTVHCNVTTYDGPGSAPPLNGNVWTGNTYKTIDPCLPAQ